MPIEQKIKPPFEHVDELILCRMNMRRHRGSWRKGRMPGERALADLLGHVGLAENIPADPVDAGTRLGDACSKRLHCRRSFLCTHSLHSTLDKILPQTMPREQQDNGER